MAKNQEQRRRHIAKAFTWRFTATMTTVIITWLVTGSIELGLIVGGFESVAKLILYYLHERAWLRISFGKSNIGS